MIQRPANSTGPQRRSRQPSHLMSTDARSTLKTSLSTSIRQFKTLSSGFSPKLKYLPDNPSPSALTAQNSLIPRLLRSPITTEIHSRATPSLSTTTPSLTIPIQPSRNSKLSSIVLNWKSQIKPTASIPCNLSSTRCKPIMTMQSQKEINYNNNSNYASKNSQLLKPI